MAEEVYIPKYGQTVEEVTVIEWKVSDGTQVKKGQEILEIETDKTTFTVEAEASGFLHRGPFEAGQVVPVLTVVGIIGKQDEKFGAPSESAAAPAESRGLTEGASAEATTETAPTAKEAAVTAAAGAAAGKVFASPRARKLAAEKGVDVSHVTPTGGGGQRVAERDVLAYLSSMSKIPWVSGPKATPVAQKLAAEAGLDLRTVTGTGPAGRITREDVEQAIRLTVAPAPIPAPTAAPPQPGDRRQETEDGILTERPAAAPAAIPAKPMPLPAVEVSSPTGKEVIERVPLKGVRAIIADRMGTSVHTTARVTLMIEVDATEFVSIRERLKAKVTEAWGFSPGYNDLLALIVAKALRAFPNVNARLAPDAIERLAHVNLGMAVDTERGLIVPVIRDADRKSLREFGAEFRELVDRARKGKSLPDDLAGGTFTITNLGMFDIDAFTPVINLPEAAILGVGRIAPKWAYRPENPTGPVLRQMMTLSLVFDHRVVDGAPAARFLQYVKELIEEPYLWFAT